ncbi:hypothetical protein PV11_06015 [Exophiala sideris]|uniref:NACHT domain-containing protein n=1 Tax=Exophiala sideris TaxID=1016849 RepID=A0A0D1W5Z8_9EURO|nr:hypothetical protein PV11_06015 [Exophiala sideris]
MGTVSGQLNELLVRLDQQQQDLLCYLGYRHDSLVEAIHMSNTAIQKKLESIAKDLKDDNAAQHIATRASLKRDLDRVAQEMKLHDELNSVLKSLHFPGMVRRQELIKPGHRKTCEWIFASSYDKKLKWDNFVDWLQDGKPVYWVFGKAGSGKSTLMRFLAQDERIKNTLTVSTKPPLIILKFFFWEDGDDLQKNRLGLMRSLLWQLLKGVGESLAVQLLGSGIVPDPQLEWSEERLLMALKSALSRTRHRLCVFLDGLDEFKDAEDDLFLLVEVINTFRGLPNVKICISSRPSPILTDKFKDCPKLRLQDFTKRDITAYVQDKLIEHMIRRFSIGKDSETASLLVDTVVDRAEGVFLWVHLAVKSLIRGIGKQDSVEDLQGRLDQMPSGLNELYSHMWKRTEADQAIYAAEAATYLQIILHFGSDSLSLIELMAASDQVLHTALSDSSWARPGFLHELGQQLDRERCETRLMACCAGFLEIRNGNDGGNDGGNDVDGDNDDDGDRLPAKNLLQQQQPPDGVPDNEILRGQFSFLQEDSPLLEDARLLQRLRALQDVHKKTRVSLIHKSAGEYLRQGAGKATLHANPLSEQDVRIRRFKAVEVLILLLVIPPHPWSVIEAATKTQHSYLTEQSAFSMLSELERVCEALRSKYHVDFASWPWIEDSKAVDYALAFLDFNVPEFTSLKINQPGTLRSQENLDWCLFKAIYYHSSFLLDYDQYKTLSEKDTNIEVLLRAKANPNSKTHMAFFSTTWLTFLGMMLGSFGFEHPLWPRLLEAFMCAGADPNAFCDIRLESDTDTSSTIDLWKMTDFQADSGDDVIYLRWTALDILASMAVDSELLNMMRSKGSQRSYINIVVYHAPNSWFVRSDEHPVQLAIGLWLDDDHDDADGFDIFGIRMWPKLDGSPSDSSFQSSSIWEGLTLDFRFSESFFTYSAGFSSRDEALRAAGWPDESVPRMNRS